MPTLCIYRFNIRCNLQQPVPPNLNFREIESIPLHHLDDFLSA